MLNGTDELYTRLEYRVGPTLMLLHDITASGHGLVLFISINRTKWRTDVQVCLLNASILDRSTWMDVWKKKIIQKKSASCQGTEGVANKVS